MQENADVIADRLPPALRPMRRLTSIWAKRLPVALLALSLVGASALFAQSMTAPTPVVRPPADWVPEPNLAGVPASIPDMSLLTRPLRPRSLALGVRRVVLDPGHGGENLGTASASGLLEKTITLDLAQRARRLLADRGFEVVLTRAADDTRSLKHRATTANQARADIFVSIHLNSFEPARARGIETFYLGPSQQPEHEAVAEAENQHSGYSLADMRTLLDGIYVDARRHESKRLAQSVQDAIVQRLKTIDATTTDRGVKTAPFVVLVATGMPSILAEVSCLSNPDEAKRLGKDDYRQTIAEALVSGIQDFVDSESATLRKEGHQ